MTTQDSIQPISPNNLVDQVEIVVESDNTLVNVVQPLPFRRYFKDAFILTGVYFVLEAVCKIYGPYKRGFFCNDESIRYEFKPNSVSVFDLLIYITSFNFITIMAVEGYRLNSVNLSDEFYSTFEHGRTRLGRLAIRLWIFFGYFVACVMIVNSLTTATKYPIGRLRPHFLDVCRPNVGYNSCETSQYITDYKCSMPMDIFKQEARLSFFSGHSSVALTSATFFWFYTQDRLAGQLSSQVVVPILQTLKLSSALLIAYTRILDNWHHWSDVVVGCLVGIFVTTLLCKYFVGFKPKIQTDVTGERSHLLNHNRQIAFKGIFCASCKGNTTRVEPTY